MTDNDHPDTEEGLLHTWTDSTLAAPAPTSRRRTLAEIFEAVIEEHVVGDSYRHRDTDEIVHSTWNEDVAAKALLDLPQMQQLKRFVHGAAHHAASVGMEKSMEKYLEAMGLDEITIGWVLS